MQLRPRGARRTTTLVALALLGAACGQAVDGDLPRSSGAVATGQVPESVSVMPTSPPADTIGPVTPQGQLQVAVAQDVEVLDPRIKVLLGDEAEPNRLLRIQLLDGVTGLTGYSRFEGFLYTATQSEPVEIIAVDPTSFRPLTPAVTAEVPAVWERLHEGNILVRHDVAHRLGLELGGVYSLNVDGQAVDVRVGAFASNGAPPVADVVVPWSLGSQFGYGDVTEALVGLTDKVRPTTVARLIEAELADVDAIVRDGPAQYQASLRGTGVQVPAFSYTDLGDGMIVIDPAWVREWIVVVDFPHLGRTRTNRLMVEPMSNVLNDLASQGILELLRPEEFAGSWVPRHIDWNPAKSLSWHAWGLAIDVNARSNPLGATPTLDPRVVATFERWGFRWGGNWRRPDGMHFELDRIVSAG